MNIANRRSESIRHIDIKDREKQILIHLHTFTFLTASQLTRLLGYRPSSLKFVQRTLRDLKQEGLVECERLQRSVGVGSAPLLFRVSRRGRLWLRKRGLSDPDAERRSTAFRRGWWFAEHFQAVTDVLISASTLSGFEPRVHLEERKFELDLRRLRLKTTIQNPEPWQLRTRTVIPDALLRFAHYVGDKQVLTVAWIERDLGSEWKDAWERKLRAILSFLEHEYESHFGRYLPTIAVVTDKETNRMEQLRRWTEEFLERRDLIKWGRLFCFTDAPADTTPPSQFWTQALWMQPFSTERVPLLDLTSGQIRTVRFRKAIRLN